MTALDDQLNATITIPVRLLQYIDSQCIRNNGDQAAAAAFNAALNAAFPDGPPGGCGGPIDMTAPVTTRSALTYDPQNDQCNAGKCAPERAVIMWYGEPVFMCPMHFEDVLGAPPMPGQMAAMTA
jgi:hypothetical protein